MAVEIGRALRDRAFHHRDPGRPTLVIQRQHDVFELPVQRLLVLTGRRFRRIARLTRDDVEPGTDPDIAPVDGERDARAEARRVLFGMPTLGLFALPPSASSSCLK